jgi:PAS domain S-box-containing protein
MKKTNESNQLRDYSTTITILENISDAVLILDGEGKIQYANRTALLLLDSDLLDLIGLDAARVIYPAGAGEDPAQLLEQFRNGSIVGVELELRAKKRRIPVDISAGVVRNPDGSIQYLILTAKDLTMRKNLERELRQQQFLAISRDRIRALGDLSIGVVHQLSQPLASLKLSTELMQHMTRRENPDTSQLEKHVGNMMQLIDDMSGIINKIRSFAYQTEDSSQVMINLPQSVENVLQLVSYDLDKRDIKVTVDAPEDLPATWGNPVSVEQGFVTLLKNAWDRFDKIPLDIGREITIKMINRDSRWVEITFSDNAGGIDPENMKRLFDPFYSSAAESGSHVGLSIVRGIVTSMGGDFVVQPDEEKQTVYVLKLPADQQKEKDQLINLIEMMRDESV